MEDAVEDAMGPSESRRSHAELGDCGLDISVAHGEAAMSSAVHREQRTGLVRCLSEELA